MSTDEHLNAPVSADLQVLICTHNREELLARTLESLNACARPQNLRLEIVVVANACTDGTLNSLENYRKRHTHENLLPLRWIEEPRAGKSHALNVALSRMHTDIVALVDDDQRAEKGYLMAICDAAQRYPEADMFCGRLLPDWDGTEPRWIHETGAYRIYPTPVPHFDIGEEPKRVMSGMKIPSGGNLVLRRDLFNRVGPFSLELGPQGHDLGGAEDIDWIRRALSIDAHLQYIPKMMQFHHVDPDRVTLRYLIKKAYERSASTSRFIWARREQVRLPAYMYRKTMNYSALALFSLNAQRRRFYLIRLAAALGEIKGFRQCRKGSSRHAAGSDA